ncbi:extracellular solute-binding protein [Desulfallas sp. Bu1-1]|jgi:molybdate/tungstate transport system substrate-binding protein|uniref:extracellular solute-binding protein n=1 Tax=Desulfallas sp. Bu1-1 TaxID=2787620 RepID=UPI00189CF3E2|nr:extracellular solute-binding protein [Desulfallas sp. Bu1-1]MBF7082544.1 extracellular solute-binding protein [Desulfallas sp. Bu1-1]
MKTDPDALKILHAGALRKPIKECIHILWEKYPGLKVELDYAGSRACARAVAEGKVVDVIALADYKVFNDILIPKFVDTSFVFATDQMVLAFDEFSTDSHKINEQNWMDVLLGNNSIKYARSDHRLDPCGYRTLMLWQLAEDYYRRPGLYNLLENNWSNLYPKSLDLAVALMEGKIDYGFEYLSVAKQMNLQYILFPPEINLSDPRFAGFYARAKVIIEGNYPGLETEITGAPIEFAVAIPKNSNQKELAQEFIDILTGPRGEEILEQNGLIPC